VKTLKNLNWVIHFNCAFRQKHWISLMHHGSYSRAFIRNYACEIRESWKMKLHEKLNNSPRNSFHTLFLRSESEWLWNSVCCFMKFSWNSRLDGSNWNHSDTALERNYGKKEKLLFRLENFTSARIRMPKYWIHAKNKIFIPTLFMFFSGRYWGPWTR
jgi:hypothetical protein